MRTAWDYTSLARHYDKRAEYSSEAIDALLAAAQVTSKSRVADVGAGTGKLTTQLLNRGLQVTAIEPNDAMRKFGMQNTSGRKVKWIEATGEKTTLADKSMDLITFGSSFNVTDRQRTLEEVHRVLVNGGWFACMWNHRDLTDPLQKKIEDLIHSMVPGYDYGTRREDQTEVINSSGFFQPARHTEGNTIHSFSRDDYMEAWRSHATLARQAGPSFAKVIAAIEDILKAHPSLDVPYTTRIWFARVLDH